MFNGVEKTGNNNNNNSVPNQRIARRHHGHSLNGDQKEISSISHITAILVNVFL